MCLDQWVNNRMFQSILVTALFILKRKLFKCFNITRDSFRRVMAQVFPELCHHHHYFHEVDHAPHRDPESYCDRISSVGVGGTRVGTKWGPRGTEPWKETSFLFRYRDILLNTFFDLTCVFLQRTVYTVVAWNIYRHISRVYYLYFSPAIVMVKTNNKQKKLKHTDHPELSLSAIRLAKVRTKENNHALMKPFQHRWCILS